MCDLVPHAERSVPSEDSQTWATDGLALGWMLEKGHPGWNRQGHLETWESIFKMITKHGMKNKENMYKFYFFIWLLKIRTNFKVNMCKNMKEIENKG